MRSESNGDGRCLDPLIECVAVTSVVSRNRRLLARSRVSRVSYRPGVIEIRSIINAISRGCVAIHLRSSSVCLLLVLIVPPRRVCCFCNEVTAPSLRDCMDSHSNIFS